MNIGVYITCNMMAGGGYNQAINALHQITKICNHSNHKLKVFTNSIENFKFLDDEYRLIEIKTKKSDKWIAFTNYSKLAQYAQKKIRIRGNFESILEKNKIDLMYFVEPGPQCLYLEKINYILTVWDNAHRDYPEFPEVRLNYAFIERENELRLTLPRAILVICDSAELVERISQRYSIDKNKLLAMPFTPFSERYKLKGNVDISAIKKKYNIKRDYFFYPAQFWPHKNHIRIIEAFKLKYNHLSQMQVVFCGAEKNNLLHVKNTISKNTLEENFRIVGFVEESDLIGLYLGARAIIMPTYFGPTNLPPFEAWECGIPLIYSKMFAGQVGDAALLIDPDSSESIALAMIEVLEDKVARSLVKKGLNKKSEYLILRRKAETILQNEINIFANRRRCWN
jgi:glycosyltransferase involved in cell wall biosynthesis